MAAGGTDDDAAADANVSQVKWSKHMMEQVIEEVTLMEQLYQLVKETNCRFSRSLSYTNRGTESRLGYKYWRIRVRGANKSSY